MALVLNGSGTISGITAGGLPDGVITADDLASGVGGKVLQVVSTTKTDTWGRNTSSTDWADVTGMSASITPTSSSSKVLVFVDLKIGMLPTTENRIKFRVLRNASNIGGQAIAYHYQYQDNYQDRLLLPSILIMQDSPASATSTTYKVQHANHNAVTSTTWINRSGDNEVSSTASSITLMEIAG